jgi:hypothetical protein
MSRWLRQRRSPLRPRRSAQVTDAHMIVFQWIRDRAVSDPPHAVRRSIIEGRRREKRGRTYPILFQTNKRIRAPITDMANPAG